MSLVQHEPVGTQLTTTELCWQWRYDCFLELGFNEVQAEALASAKSTSVTYRKGKSLRWRTPLHHGRVREALEAGCSHDLAVQIFV